MRSLIERISKIDCLFLTLECYNKLWLKWWDTWCRNLRNCEVIPLGCVGLKKQDTNENYPLLIIIYHIQPPRKQYHAQNTILDQIRAVPDIVASLVLVHLLSHGRLILYLLLEIISGQIYGLTCLLCFALELLLTEKIWKLI